ncbi:hypothetical protein Bcep1808_7147 (plasmid) [Burkholderia vietnamiensis G4]|uniref:Uncharacterized protein n=1 Tax=Burkholderia vietnamiensis (strain G4 / LMG 22486) TaxID=269482 RepID=A4JS73_BURVG|nr:hypothetical protein Bcep1808_6220 [Burkholderia vietnamiensis G4]ABO60029.1 hypothetical protein Bcep1808_7147 [Burkholderia vietnamiensis G4]
MSEDGHVSRFKLQLATIRKHANVHAQLRSLYRHSEVARGVIRSADIGVHADALGGRVLRSVHLFVSKVEERLPYSNRRQVWLD